MRTCCQSDSGNFVGKATLSNGMYKLEQPVIGSFLANSIENQDLWHRRLGHIGVDNLKRLNNGLVNGLIFKNEQRPGCKICMKGKQCRVPFQLSNSRACAILELVHSDLCGPVTVDSFGGSRYFLTFLDDFSRKIFVYTIKRRSEVFEKFKEFKNFYENFAERKIKTLRSDNGGKYCNTLMSPWRPA